MGCCQFLSAILQRCSRSVYVKGVFFDFIYMCLEILLPHIQLIFQLLIFRVLAMLTTLLMMALLHVSEVNGLSELSLVLVGYID